MAEEPGPSGRSPESIFQTKISHISANRLFRLLLAAVVFHGAVQALAIGASLLAIPIGRTTALGILGISAALAWLAWRSWRRQADDSCIADGMDHESELAGAWPWIIVSIAAAYYVAMLAFSIAGYDSSWDGNAYHIPAIHAYLAHQQICWIEEPFGAVAYMNGYPKGAELLAMILVQAFHPSLLNVANVLLLPLGALGVAYLARGMGASASLALLAGAAWLLLPVNVAQAATTYVDSSFASCVAAYLAILFFILRHAGILQASGGPSRWLPAAALGCALGLAIGVKSSGIAIGGLGIAGLAAFWALTMAKNQPCPWARRIFVLVGFFGVVLATGTAIGGSWYLRNWVRTGSPLYPVGIAIAGHQVFPGASVAETIGAGPQTPVEMRGLPSWKATLINWLQFRWPKSILGVDSRRGGLGYLWIVGCLPATGWVLVRALRYQRSDAVGVVFLIALVAAAFLIQPMCWWARYTLWIHAVGLPCFAVAACHGLRGSWAGADARPFRAKAVRFWFTCCCAALLIEGTLSVFSAGAEAMRFPLRQVLRNPVRTWREPRRPDWRSRAPEAFQGTVLEGVLSSREPVAFGPQSGDGRFVGWLCDPIGQRIVYALPDEPDAARILGLQRNGVRQVVWDAAFPLPETLRAASISIEPIPGAIVLTLRPPENVPAARFGDTRQSR